MLPNGAKRRASRNSGTRFDAFGDVRPADRAPLPVTYVLAVVGIALLVSGGETVVRGSVALAARLGVSPLVVGIAVVGFGTSLPEMVVCVDAALSGVPGIAVGNVIGSNVANVLLILGVGALIFPGSVAPRTVRRDALCMLAATVVFVGLGLAGGLVRWHGALMLAALGGYVAATVRRDAGSAAAARRGEDRRAGAGRLSSGLLAALVAAGIGGVVVGAEWLVSGAAAAARGLGVPEEVIGLTLVAVGTSLPELATAIAAACRGRPELCVGNVIGSTIFNLFGIAGVTVLFAPLPFSDRIVGFDLWAMLGATLLLMAFLLSGRRIGRTWGGAFAVLYGLFAAAAFLGWGETAARAVTGSS